MPAFDYGVMRARGAGDTVEDARQELNVIDSDWKLVKAAAAVKVQGGLSFADAFCIATAERLDAPLWTGGPEIIGPAVELGREVIDLR
jgi:predicted nucleic acid-binding protein